MRVLHVLGDLNTGGGIENFVMNVYRNIDCSLVQFDFLVNTFSNDTKEENHYEKEIKTRGGKVYKMTAFTKNPIINLIEQNKFFKTQKYDAVEVHSGSPLKYIYCATAKKHKVKTTIFHAHGASDNPKSFLHKYTEKKLKKYCDFKFACATKAGLYVYGDNADVKIVPNAIDVEKFKYDTGSRAQKRKELNIEEKFVVGHIGRMSPEKNHKFLLEIFKEIHRKNNSAMMLLVGDGLLRGAIEKQASDFGLKDSIIFAGQRSDIPELLCAMDVFVFPSLWEGLGIALIEAQTNGLPCLVSDVVPDEANITELVENISLKETADFWARKALSYVNGYERRRMQTEVTQAGYDIKDVAKWLQDFYLNNL